MKTLDLLRTMVGHDGGVSICDTIEHEGDLWLVPEWRRVPDGSQLRPARMIRLTGHRYQHMSNPDYGAHFLLNESLPLPVLDGVASDEWIVLMEPELWFEAPILQ